MAKRKPKHGFLDGYRTYDPAVEGYGSPDEWRSAFNRTMGLDEAESILGADDPLAVLGLQSGATAQQIRKAWKRAAFKWHPDRNHGNEDHASEQFKRAKAAHVKLGEP